MQVRSTAVVHDWLIGRGGGSEALLGELLDIHAPADLYALIDRYDDECRRRLPYRHIHTSWLDRIPGAGFWYKQALPLIPAAVESLDLRGHDLVVSDAHAVAKGVITEPDQVHISYCYTPMRYIWDLRHEYMERVSWARRIPPIFRDLFFARLRLWDYVASQRPTRLVACSGFVSRRIAKYYGRDARVVYPPVPVEEFTPERNPGDYYLTVGRPAPNKRLETLVHAFRRMPERKLIIIGPDWKSRRHKIPDNVEVLPYMERDRYREYVQKAKAFVYAGIEDFGIAMVEAQAAGKPVLAFNGGASPEIVRPVGESSHPTGALFETQQPDGVVAAVLAFDTHLRRISAEACHDNARRFEEPRFRAGWSRCVDETLNREEAPLSGRMHLA